MNEWNINNTNSLNRSVSVMTFISPLLPFPLPKLYYRTLLYLHHIFFSWGFDFRIHNIPQHFYADDTQFYFQLKLCELNSELSTSFMLVWGCQMLPESLIPIWQSWFSLCCCTFSVKVQTWLNLFHSILPPPSCTVWRSFLFFSINKE